MTGTAQTAKAVAVVCGSNSLVGGMVTTRLRDAGWDVFTIDPPHAAPHPAARVRIKGEIWEAAAWAALLKSLPDSGQPPGIFVHAFGDSENDAGAISNHALRSAEQGARHLLPAMTAGGAVAFVASVLAGWDTRAGAAAFSAGQAGILALMRSLALSAAPSGIRVNAVCTGIVTTEPDVAPAAVRGRIPLGRTASPDDVADAVLFLLSSDASHVTGSTLIVDGGQSLQSWSNAPREGGYPLVIAPTSERKNGVSLSDSERAESRQCETDGGRTTRFFVPQNDTATVQDTTTQRDTATPQRFQNQT
ncbi:MAG: SDR family oxidoreductase, partial [Chloroflexia bacterium]|nr:SDR family oxidoreductase [Chloroflexia bacterium]